MAPNAGVDVGNALPWLWLPKALNEKGFGASPEVDWLVFPVATGLGLGIVVAPKKNTWFLNFKITQK